MRFILVGVALAAISSAALAEDTDWAFFEPDDAPMQAGLIAQDGSQLILKCDKPGKQKVFAVLVATTGLAAPMSDDKYESRPVTVRMDEDTPWDDNWRFNDRFAIAVDMGTTRSLTRLLEKLVKAEKMEIRLRPNRGVPQVIRFDTKGAREALTLVYESCKDDPPFE